MTSSVSDYATSMRSGLVAADNEAIEIKKKLALEQKEQKATTDTTTKSIVTNTVEQKQNTRAYNVHTTQLGKAINTVISYGSALTLVRQVSRQLVNTIKEMDQALTNMTVVTSLTREQA